jgi:hypothetical protein
LTFHATLFLLVGLFGGVATPQPGREPDRDVGIALVSRTAGEVNYFSEAEVQTPAAGDETTAHSVSGGAPASAALPSLDQLPVDLAVQLPSSEAFASASGGPSLPRADGFTRGVGKGSGPGGPGQVPGGGGTSTSVFGVQGTGNKFVYLFDRSASMEGFGGRPIRAAKAELIASLRDLESVHQFQIIFYNNRPKPFNPNPPQPPHMMFGTEENRRLAEQFVRGIKPAGGTRHYDALWLALGLHPDVIFMLTDADEPELTAAELEAIRRRNRSGAAIHTIEFGSSPFARPNNFLLRLASQNRGQHVYIQVTRLAPRG